MTRAPHLVSKSPSIPSLRAQIEAAIAEGLTTEDLTLCLTHRDRMMLSRDPATPLADVSYVGGIMRFLGVRVQRSAGAVSGLQRCRA
jgi:hypothetical protein